MTGATPRSDASVREYLAALDAAGEPIEAPCRPTDPAARWTAAPGGPAFLCLLDELSGGCRAGIIVDVEATPALRTQEVDRPRR